MRSILNYSRFFFSVFAAASCLMAEQAGTQTPMPSRTVIEIDGVKFSAADLQRKSKGSLFQARNALFEAERKAADELINDYVLNREAKTRNLTVDELLKQDVYSTLKEPSEEALRVYYDGVDTSEPYEAVRGKILDAIRQRRMAKAKTAYVQSLRSRANISVMLLAPRADMAMDNAPVRGAASPAVVLVEYADYECPYCQQIQPTVTRLESEFKDKLAFVFKDVPLPMHANAQKAAEAAHCAAAQGKFWEYHDRLFATRQYDIAHLKEHARTLNLDGASFDQCLDSGAQAERIKQYVGEAQAIGLPGTPGFFVNGRFISGAVDYGALRKVIEEELRTASSQVTSAMNGGER